MKLSDNPEKYSEFEDRHVKLLALMPKPKELKAPTPKPSAPVSGRSRQEQKEPESLDFKVKAETASEAKSKRSCIEPKSTPKMKPPKKEVNLLKEMSKSIVPDSTDPIPDNIIDTEGKVCNLRQAAVKLRQLESYTQQNNNHGLHIQFQRGFMLTRFHLMCRKKNLSFLNELGNRGLENGQGWTYWRKNFYKFCLKYPRVLKTGCSANFYHSNFVKIKIILESLDPEELKFWQST